MPPLATSFPPPGFATVTSFPSVATISAMAASRSIGGKLPPILPSLSALSPPFPPPHPPSLPPSLSSSLQRGTKPSLTGEGDTARHWHASRTPPPGSPLAANVVSVGPLHPGRAPAGRPSAPFRHLPPLPPMPSHPFPRSTTARRGRGAALPRRPPAPRPSGEGAWRRLLPAPKRFGYPSPPARARGRRPSTAEARPPPSPGPWAAALVPASAGLGLGLCPRATASPPPAEGRGRRRRREPTPRPVSEQHSCRPFAPSPPRRSGPAPTTARRGLRPPNRRSGPPRPRAGRQAGPRPPRAVDGRRPPCLDLRVPLRRPGPLRSLRRRAGGEVGSSLPI